RRVLLEEGGPGSRDPVKPIGRMLDRDRALALERDLGWAVGEVAGGWRRLVPSPRPLAIVERDQIRRLLEADTIVIAAGGGGTPVYRARAPGLEGLDGVVDKDRAAAVLARDIGAEVLRTRTDADR